MLEQDDVSAIESAVATKSVAIESLRQLDEQRDALCRSWGFASGDEQMAKVIAWCDDSSQVAERWQQLLDVATESSSANLTNGAIIRLRQQQFESKLSLLRGRTPRIDTYGQHGGGTGDFGRQSLAQA